MIKKELTCICCPLGCSLEVQIDVKNNVEVSGNGCKRGEAYGIKECTNPTRVVTSTVVLKDGKEKVVPVKTERDIPKDRIFECVRFLKGVAVEAPVRIGDVIVENILGMGINIVATKNIDRA